MSYWELVKLLGLVVWLIISAVIVTLAVYYLFFH